MQPAAIVENIQNASRGNRRRDYGAFNAALIT